MDAIQRMKDICSSQIEVWRILGACIFYCVWIPHYAHVADPLYSLLQKRKRFKWKKKHTETIRKLKRLLSSPLVLQRISYEDGKSVILTIDISPIAVGWTLGQNDEEGNRFAIRFGAKRINEQKRNYLQVKQELWKIVTTMKNRRDYLIGAPVIVETYCLLLLEMITNCNTLDIAMLRWIAYIKSLNSEFRHIVGKDNLVTDMNKKKI